MKLISLNFIENYVCGEKYKNLCQNEDGENGWLNSMKINK